MSFWTVILCEGAHDAAAVASLSLVCGGWNRADGTPKSLPEPIADSYPSPKRGKSGQWLTEREPWYLTKGNRYLEIRALGGIQQILGDHALDLLDQMNPEAVGVIVDANEEGVTKRTQAFRRRYSRLFGHAANIRAGEVLSGPPPIGLWVVPDNSHDGRMDQLLIAAARLNHSQVIEKSEGFTKSLAKIEPGPWVKQMDKAVLGSANQIVRPGASLAVSLESSRSWFDQEVVKVDELKSLHEFVEKLTGS